MSAGRLQSLRESLDDVDLLVVSQPVNIRYLTAFTEVFDSGFSGFLVVSAQRAVLVTDFRYEQQLIERASGSAVEILSARGSALDALAGVVKDSAATCPALEDGITVGLRDRIQEACGFEFAMKSGIVESLRAVKDSAEIEAISAAARVADEAYGNVLDSIRPGASTRKMALDLEWFMRTHGAQAAAFDVIVACGARSSMPHATTTDQTVQAGDFVKMDFGAVVDDYRSDITRTVIVDLVDDRKRRMYEATLEAQALALDQVAPGKSGSEIDRVAREYLSDAGFGENFGHNLGHGVGLEVHERPTLGVTSKDILAEGMVVTVEPGVYVPGLGGVRIEDLVVVEEGGARSLTAAPKGLTVV